VSNIKLSDYLYDLPDKQIAKYGIVQRDQSKLLKYSNGKIENYSFSQIADLIPSNSTMFFNNTKVIQARLFLKRKTGAKIEVFLLAPANNKVLLDEALTQHNQVVFKCMIGNLKKWRDGEILEEIITIDKQKIKLKVALHDRIREHVNFSWEPEEITFYDILEVIGHTPLPPYLNRPDEAKDRLRYQTVYSKLPGAVAAPTAGLHFTDKILASLKAKGIRQEYLTLHVSAGTFKPIKDEEVSKHPMHSEQIFLTHDNLEAILSSEYIIAVGTTAMRTMESAYWYGVQIIQDNNANFQLNKLVPYDYDNIDLPSMQTSISAVLEHMKRGNLQKITGHTEIFILPGYKFKVCNGLVTNFHQPGSTLILLVAAFVGKNWRIIYRNALSKNYKFLSYGDSSLLLR